MARDEPFFWSPSFLSSSVSSPSSLTLTCFRCQQETIHVGFLHLDFLLASYSSEEGERRTSSVMVILCTSSIAAMDEARFLVHECLLAFLWKGLTTCVCMCACDVCDVCGLRD